ncbi:TraB/GumN family protein [Sphingomonas canadensis]|uniref:TraB/GumN family protein n=1 Tax=Sphingomonas canadensis TaxID=1219257 RepID=A0ABW3H9K9_9SPHN|nr:TraB/GumN family protein [Sphingomonas canadensis]MCW3836060.1 TraB/GumN family protein [Sphingomonas canadensis]
MRSLLLFLAALLALGGCRSDPGPVADADPALWVVRDEDTTIYLFGTVHVLRPGLGWFDEAVKDAFDKSDEVVLELLIPPAPEMSALVDDLGENPPGAPRLSRTLPPETAKKLAEALERLGRQPDALDRYDPWVAATLVGTLPAQELGYSASAGAEEVLRQAAERGGKRLIGLETAREQLGYFDSLSPPAQRALLARTLNALPDGAATLEAIIGEWARGDASALARRINAELKDTPEVEAALLTGRNRRWADWIAARLRQPGTVFVAVGAGHLAGKGSVQEMLAGHGLKAARVAY